MLPFVENAKISPGFCSDHSLIELDVDFSKFVRGKGFWKFNSSLLYDTSYCEIVKNTIKRVVAQYGVIENNANFYETVSKEALRELDGAISLGILVESPSILKDDVSNNLLMLPLC